MIEIKVKGEYINDAIDRAINVSIEQNSTVFFLFNGKKVICTPKSDSCNLSEQYCHSFLLGWDVISDERDMFSPQLKREVKEAELNEEYLEGLRELCDSTTNDIIEAYGLEETYTLLNMVLDDLR